MLKNTKAYHQLDYEGKNINILIDDTP